MCVYVCVCVGGGGGGGEGGGGEGGVICIIFFSDVSTKICYGEMRKKTVITKTHLFKYKEELKIFR